MSKKQMLTLSMSIYELKDEPNTEASLLGLTLKGGDLLNPISLIIEVFSENQVTKNVHAHGVIPHTLYANDLKNIKENLVRLDWAVKQKEQTSTVNFEEKRMNIYQSVLPLLGKEKTIECFESLGLSFEEDRPKKPIVKSHNKDYTSWGDWA